MNLSRFSAKRSNENFTAALSHFLAKIQLHNSGADGEIEPKLYWVVGSANVALRGINVIGPCDPAVCHTSFYSCQTEEQSHPEL